MTMFGRKDNLRWMFHYIGMLRKILGPQLLKLFVELTSWTQLVEILETDQSTLIVESTKLIRTLTLLIDKGNYLTTKRCITGSIRRESHGISMKITEEMLNMIFNEQK